MNNSKTLAIVLAVALLLRIFLPDDFARGIFFGFMGIWLLVSVVKEWRDSDAD